MSFITKNIAFGPPLKLSAWRKVAIGTWSSCGDPSVYGILELEAEKALAYIEKTKVRTGAHITFSHFIAKALATAIHRHPDINCVLRFGRLYPRKTVDIFLQVASDKRGKDLSGTVLRSAHEKSLEQLANELQSKVMSIRNKGDLDYAQMKGLIGSLPGWASRCVLNAGGFLMYALNLWGKFTGVPRDSFGSAMLTNVGSLGLDEAFAPLVPYSRVPLLIAAGAVQDKPVVRNGAVVVGKTIKLCATFDHRVIDGVHASHMSRTLKEIFANPEKEFGEKHHEEK